MTPQQAGQIAVMMGGISSERDISLRSGAAVLQALKARGFNAQAMDTGQPFMRQLAQGGYQRAFILLHGAGGEDGRMQGALDLLKIPYTGSGVQSSAVAFDKALCKIVWRDAGLPTPDFCVVSPGSTLPHITFPLPWVVKPARAGSSQGITMVDSVGQLAAALLEAGRYDGKVVVEQWIAGGEYTAGILQGRVLPLVKLETPRRFYDYVAKYQSNDTGYICPCGLAEEREKELADIVLAAFDAVGASGWGRVDFVLGAAGGMRLLELNTVPGMTEHSLLPKAAKMVGLDFADLACEILDGSVAGAGGGPHVAL